MIRLHLYILEYIIRLSLNLRALKRPSSRHHPERPFNYREMQLQQQHYTILINTINIASVCKKWREIVLKNLYILELNPYALFQLRKYNQAKNNAFIKEFDTNLLVKVLRQFPSVKSVHLSFFNFVRSSQKLPAIEPIPPLSLSLPTSSNQQQQKVSDYAPLTLLSQSMSPILSSTQPRSVKDRINTISDENEPVSITSLEIVSCVNFRSIGFVNYLINSTQLKSLVIDQCELRDSDCSIIVHAIKSSTSLKTLSLRRNQLQDEGGKAISVLIEESSRIAEIYLSNNMISQNGTLAISNALRRNKSLIHLSLDNNYLSMDSALSLISCFETNKTLKQLDIRGNYFQSKLLVEAIPISIAPDVNILIDNELTLTQQPIIRIPHSTSPQFQSPQLSLPSSYQSSPYQSPYQSSPTQTPPNQSPLQQSYQQQQPPKQQYRQQHLKIQNLNNINKHDTLQNTFITTHHSDHHYLFNYNNNSFFNNNNNNQLIEESKKRKFEKCK